MEWVFVQTDRLETDWSRYLYRQGVYVNRMVFTTWFLRLHHVGCRPKDVSSVYPELVSLPWPWDCDGNREEGGLSLRKGRCCTAIHTALVNSRYVLHPASGVQVCGSSMYPERSVFEWLILPSCGSLRFPFTDWFSVLCTTWWEARWKGTEHWPLLGEGHWMSWCVCPSVSVCFDLGEGHRMSWCVCPSVSMCCDLGERVTRCHRVICAKGTVDFVPVLTCALPIGWLPSHLHNNASGDY